MGELICGKSGSMYIICHLYRPGALNFATELEYRHFPPDEKINELYNIFNVTYDGGMHYVIEIPAGLQSYDIASEIAQEFNLKMVPGKPFNGRAEFPVQCSADKCFVLETADHNSVSASASVSEEAYRLREKYVS
jgi:hypothetical protein